MSWPTIDQLVCFAILMQNREGIISKAPDYVMEKYYACIGTPEPEGLLDPKNLKKFLEYKNRWPK